MSGHSPEGIPPSKTEYAGIWLPLEILEDPDLSLSEKFIFGVISALDAGRGFWMTNDRLASQIGITPNHASVCIGNLARKGYIRIDQISGGRRTIQTIDRLSLRSASGKNDTPGSRKDGSPLMKTMSPSERIEERIQSKKEKASVSLDLDLLFVQSKWKPSIAFLDCWKAWVEYRKERKPRLTVSSASKQIEFLIRESLDEKDAIMIIENSIRNGWQGLFPIKPQAGGGKKVRVNYQQDEDLLS
jgi:hypothetical protein